MSLWISSRCRRPLLAKACVSDKPCLDLSVLLQQYQEQHEQFVSCMSEAIRREDDPVESGYTRRVSLPCPTLIGFG